MKLIMQFTEKFIVPSGWEMWVCVPMHVYVCVLNNIVYFKDNKLKQKIQERFHTFVDIWFELWLWGIMSRGGEMREDISRTWYNMDHIW